MTRAAYGTRKVSITRLARDRMSPDEVAEVNATCRNRGLRLSIMYDARARNYSAIVIAGSQPYEGIAPLPMEAWRRALALRDAPAIISLLTPDTAA